MNKKIVYCILFVLLIILIILEHKAMAGIAWALVSFYEYNTAFKEMKHGLFVKINPTKKHYANKGRLDKYQKLMLWHFIISLSISAILILDDLNKFIFT